MTVFQKHLIGVALLLAIFLLPLAATARFISVDPHAGMYPSVSPYLYANNNPLTFIDPDGRGPVSASVRAARKALSKRLISAARKRAVRRAWAVERDRVARGLKTSLKMSPSEKKELLQTARSPDGKAIISIPCRPTICSLPWTPIT